MVPIGIGIAGGSPRFDAWPATSCHQTWIVGNHKGNDHTHDLDILTFEVKNQTNRWHVSGEQLAGMRCRELLESCGSMPSTGVALRVHGDGHRTTTEFDVFGLAMIK